MGHDVLGRQDLGIHLVTQSQNCEEKPFCEAGEMTLTAKSMTCSSRTLKVAAYTCL